MAVWDEIEKLYRENRADLVRLAGLLLDEPGACEEVVHDAFVALHSTGPTSLPRRCRPTCAARS